MSRPIDRSAIRKVEHADAFPLAALQALRGLRDDLERRENEAILRARELGASLEDVADAMGLTRQGVAYRIKAMNAHGEDTTDDIVDLTGDTADRAGTQVER